MAIISLPHHQHFPTMKFLTLVSILPLLSAATCSTTPCLLAQLNQTHAQAAPSIIQIQQNHAAFLQKWWHWRCEEDPIETCARECLHREQYFEDPFTFCFESFDRGGKPREGQLQKTKDKTYAGWKRSKCVTYFSDGGVKAEEIWYRGARGGRLA